MQTNEEEPCYLLELLSNEVISYIVSLLFEGLKTANLRQGMSTDLLVSFHSMQLVSRGMGEVTRDCLKRLNIDWHAVVGKMLRSTEDDGWAMLGEHKGKVNEVLVQMTRTQLYCGAQLPLIRRELEAFRAKHNIVCHSAKSGKERKGYISMKALKRIKVSPKEVSDQYTGIIKSYAAIKKKERLLHTKLAAIRQELKRRAFFKSLLLWPGQVAIGILIGHLDEL